MKFKSTLRKVSYAPADLPTGTVPQSGELTPEQAQQYLDKSEQVPSQTISPEEAQKALEESQKLAETNKEETLEQKVERLQKELEEAKTPPKRDDEVQVDPLKDVTEKAEKAGVKVSELEQEYIKNGKLSEESMKALKEAGFSEEAVKAYISVKEEQAYRKDDELLKAVGISSREEYVNMATWFYQNMDEATIKKYDSAMSTENADVMIEKYYKLYKEATGTTTPSVQPQQSTVSVRSGTQVVANTFFANEAEMVKAIQDPRYERDYTYRNEVIKKIMNSPYKK